jgi:hypothetical protein
MHWDSDVEGMRTELQEYKCPSCGRQLGETEYIDICEKNQKILEQIAEQRLEPLKVQHDKEIRKLKEKHDMEKEKELNIRVEKQLNQEKVWIELRHKQELAGKEAKYIQSVKENQLKLKRLETQIEKQQKIIDSTAPELRGTAGEFVLYDLLQNEFGTDRFTMKKTGISMADVVQTIVTETGETIPTRIAYDVKTGEIVTKSDITKAKNYMSIHNTPHSIIVTKNIKNERYTEVRDGILLVHPLAVIDIAQQIRKSLIETRILIKNNTGRITKQSKLYDYFTSQEYSRNIRERIELKLNLDNINRREETLRNKRNGFIEKLLEIDNKNHAIVKDITQDDIDIQNQTEYINVKQVPYVDNKKGLQDVGHYLSCWYTHMDKQKRYTIPLQSIKEKNLTL